MSFGQGQLGLMSVGICVSLFRQPPMFCLFFSSLCPQVPIQIDKFLAQHLQSPLSSAVCDKCIICGARHHEGVTGHKGRAFWSATHILHKCSSATHTVIVKVEATWLSLWFDFCQKSGFALTPTALVFNPFLYLLGLLLLHASSQGGPISPFTHSPLQRPFGAGWVESQ